MTLTHDRQSTRIAPRLTGLIGSRAFGGMYSRCACGPGTAPPPARSTRRHVVAAQPRRAAAVCLRAPASWVWRRPTSPARSTWRETWRRLRRIWTRPSRGSRTPARLGPGTRRERVRAVAQARRVRSAARAARSRPGCAASCTPCRRDRAAIAHHYDLSNDFYALHARPIMAYSCAYLPATHRRTRSSDAQRDKLDLVCRKLGLTRRACGYLDIGCGWGSLTLHAAKHYGVRVAGVTLSAEQQAFVDGGSPSAASATASRSGLQDYRERRRRPVRRRVLDRDGRARRRGNYPPSPRHRTTLLRAGRTGPGPADVAARHRARAAARSSRRSSRPTCTCARSARRSTSSRTAGLEVRDVHALREHYVTHRRRLVRHLRGELGPTRRPRRRGGRPGLAALPRRRRAGLRGGPDGRRPDPRGQARPGRPQRPAAGPRLVTLP